MEETKFKQDETAETAAANENKSDEPVDLIEMVREKHQDNYAQNEERIRDIFTMQLILSVLIVSAFVILNIFNKNMTQWYINEFKRMTIGETEQIIKDAVNYIMNIAGKL